MTQTAAICDALIRGQKLSIMNGFHLFSCTNLPREIGRQVERKFGITVEREFKKFTSKYGQTGEYCEYWLEPNNTNADALKKMIDYIKEQNISK